MCSGTEEIDRMREHFRWGNTLGSVELTVHSPRFNSAVRSVWMVSVLILVYSEDVCSYLNLNLALLLSHEQQGVNQTREDNAFFK